MRVCPICHNEFPDGGNFCPYDGHQLTDTVSTILEERDELIGKVLDNRYRLDSRLGKGGMGVVYAARHIIIDKLVAVKILRREYCTDPNQVERFAREARAASCIGHPNIVDVTDLGTLPNGQAYFVMEFLDGVTLSRELRKFGALPLERVLRLSLQICHALDAAHNKGIVHRDLKPENIFLVYPSSLPNSQEYIGRRTDVIKVLDFGIAKMTWDSVGRKLTRVGSIFGTPQYMSPEQAAGKETGYQGDIYSLGCIIYEMITGQVPFLSDTFMGTLTKHMFESPVSPRLRRPDLMIPAPWESLILKAMEKNPADRFQSMREMAAGIRDCGPTTRELFETHPPPFIPVNEDTFSPISGLSGHQDTIHEQSQSQLNLSLVEKGKSAREDISKGEQLQLDSVIDGHRQRWWTKLAITVPLGGLIVLGIVLIFYIVYSNKSNQRNNSDHQSYGVKPPEKDIHPARTSGQQHVPPFSKRKSLIRPRDKVYLKIITKPDNALISINNLGRGVSPLQILVTPGEDQKIQVNKIGYDPIVRTLTLQDDQTVIIEMMAQGASGENKPFKSKPVRKKNTHFGSVDDLKNPFILPKNSMSPPDAMN